MHVRGKKAAVFFASLMGLSVLMVTLWASQSKPGYQIESGFHIVEKAYLNHQSGMVVDVSGKVVRILSGNQEDLALQRFVIRMPNGQNVLVTHDIRASETVPVGIDDQVMVRGEYQWTETGGMINWTRRDRNAQDRDGWIVHQGDKYD